MNHCASFIWIAAGVSAFFGCTDCRTDKFDTIGIDKLEDVRVIESGVASRFAKAVFKVSVERPVDDMQRIFVDKILGDAYRMSIGACDECGDGVEEIYSSFRSNYGNACGKARDRGGLADKLELGWELTVIGELVEHQKRFISYRARVCNYYGGVHPDVWMRNGSLWRDTGRKVLTTDLFDDANMTAVLNLIRNSLRNDADLSEYVRSNCSGDIAIPYDKYYSEVMNREGVSEEGPGVPLVTDNFAIVEDGIVWTYNEYEISGYADGSINAFVGWEGLEPYLKRKDFIPKRDESAFETALREAKESGCVDKEEKLTFL